MDHQPLNDLSAGSLESVDDNTLQRTCETNYALTSASWKKVRDNLEKVRRDIESNIFSSPPNTGHHSRIQPVENTENAPFAHGSINSYSTDETNVKQPHRETGNKEGSEQIYSRHIQCGDRNFMLICEPKNTPHEKVVYKQEGNRNIMINLRVSSNIYQLVQQVNDSWSTQAIPLDSEGEVWLEIKRRSQVDIRKKSRSPGTNESTFMDTTSFASSERKKSRSPGSKESIFTDTTSLASSESDNLHYDTHKVKYKRDADEHSYHGDGNDNNQGAGRRSIEENSYVLNTKDTDEWKDSQYDILSISEESDLLKMIFSKPRDGQLEDLERMILSHHRVCDFLRDSSNDFDASLCDWMYQSDESIYSYITGRILPEVYAVGLEEVEPEDDVITLMWTKEENESLYKRWNEENGIPSHQRAIPSSSSDSLTGPPLPPRISSASHERNITQTPCASPTVQHVPQQVSKPCHTPTAPSVPPYVSIPRTSPAPPPVPPQVSNPRTTPATPPVPPQVSKPRASPTVPPVPLPVPIPPPSDDSGFSTISDPSRRDRIQDSEWYRVEITKEEAKAILGRSPPGTFIVRQATGKNAEQGGSLHAFTLEFVDENRRIKKLMIMKTGDLYHFKEYGAQTFVTVSDLVAKVLTSGLAIKDAKTSLWTTFQVKPAWRKT